MTVQDFLSTYETRLLSLITVINPARASTAREQLAIVKNRLVSKAYTYDSTKASLGTWLRPRLFNCLHKYDSECSRLENAGLLEPVDKPSLSNIFYYICGKYINCTNPRHIRIFYRFFFVGMPVSKLVKELDKAGYPHSHDSIRQNIHDIYRAYDKIASSPQN